MYIQAFGFLILVFIIREICSSGGEFKAPLWLRNQWGINYEFSVPVWKEAAGMMDSMNSGHAKVVFSTLQILSTISMSLEFPVPEVRMRAYEVMIEIVTYMNGAL